MIVVDASVLVPALADDGESGDRARRRLIGESLTAPELVDLECTSALRGLVRAGKMPERRGSLAMADLAALPLERASHRDLLPRCWQLRDNLTAYDAAYVALAELLDIAFVTADAHLSRTATVTCRIEVMDWT